MDKATRHLVHYARYHRDRRNIATHFAGIPLIAFALAVLLGRAHADVAGIALSADWVVWTLVTLWYLGLGQRLLTVGTALALAGLVALAHPLASAPFGLWLAVGLGSFLVGWVFQFVGHYWEGRKPAFVDDLRGLLVGPMFVLAEVWFAVGGGQALKARIEADAGPVRTAGTANRQGA